MPSCFGAKQPKYVKPYCKAVFLPKSLAKNLVENMYVPSKIQEVSKILRTLLEKSEIFSDLSSKMMEISKSFLARF